MTEMEMATDPAQKQALAKKALALWEDALAGDPQSESRCYLSDNAGMVAVDAGDLAKAKDYANQLLDDPAILRQGCSSPRSSLHDGNVILGRIALREGKLEQAKVFLIQAGQAGLGSDTLTTVAPKMILAEELLERGERKSVLHYFDLCAKFWQDNGALKRWHETVEAGAVPDFRVGGTLY